jgi:signal transduction histidine kinase/CheY-like chemotaxis protein
MSQANRRTPPIIPDGSTTLMPEARAESVFLGDGEMAQRMRAMDWSRTPLGPVESWSQSLRMMVGLLLANRFPLLLWWGPRFCQLYNDPYRPVLGAKHPASLGQPGSECWPEIWDVIGPLVETPFSGGPATWSDDLFLEIRRHGFVEETHFTVAYSPVPDPSAPNGIGGVLATVHEITEQVVGQRRVLALRDLGARAAEAKTAEEACRLAAGTLAMHAKDIPFALLYLLDHDGRHARLAAATGVGDDAAIGPQVIALDAQTGAGAADEHAWPLAEVVRAEEMRVVEDLASRFGAAPPGPWSDPPSTAVVAPIRSNIAHQFAGLLVAGVSARLPFDDGYAGFFELVSSQIATAIANARAYEEERRRAEALAELDRAKTAFFSNVSHEFRTPLTLMLGPLEDLLARSSGTEMSPDDRAQLDVIHRNGLRLLKLVNTLLDFARIEAGRVRATYAPTDLAVYTAELASSFRSLIERAGMRLIVDCRATGDLAEPVYVDRDMWEQIVLNLLSNAFKFTFAGEIAVTLRPDAKGKHVVLTVRDTGTGIPPHELPRLFERFHRVQNARSRSYEGSGIGLALVQELVHLHGGAIRASSRIGQGATFTVTIPTGAARLPADRVAAQAVGASTALGAAPYVEEASRWLAPPAGEGAVDQDSAELWLRRDGAGGSEFITHATAPTAPARPARILVVDDNADLRDYLRRLLASRYDVAVVADGETALAAARARPPDLVLSDVMMPGLDGFGLLRALRADPATRSVPVILLSARAGEEATVEGLEAGADDYLIKPFSAREALSRVAARLEIARARREAQARAQELEAAFAAMTDGVGIYDREGRILSANAALRAMAARALGDSDLSGTLAERATRAPLLAADGRPLSPEEWPHARVVAGETLAGSSAAEVAFDIPGGGQTHFSMTGAPLRDMDGTITSAVIITRDVTERRRLERRTREALDALVEVARELVASPDMADVGAGVRAVAGRLAALARHVLGSEFVSLAGIDAESGRFTTLATAGRSREDEAAWYATIGATQPKDYYSAEQLERLRAGEAIIVEVPGAIERGAPMYGSQAVAVAPLSANGEVAGVLSVAYARADYDFTQVELEMATGFAGMAHLVLERERLLGEREAARARAAAAEEATRRMDDFLGIASHELRTPLTSITANVQMSARHVRGLAAAAEADTVSLPDALRAQLERAGLLLERTDRQMVRLDRIIGDLLDASRIQADKLELRLELCDPVDAAREAVLEQQAAWPSRSITLDSQHSARLPVHADPDRIGQVVTNLLTNALKYSPGDQPVRVRLRRRGDMARLEVHDYGPGLTADQRERIFERFYRAPGVKQLSGSGVGLGLGLYISKTIIERHGGAIGVESAPGQGSRFWFEIPLTQAEQ